MSQDTRHPHRFFAWVGALTWWPFGRIRTGFHSALWVLYCGGFALIAVLIKFVVTGRGLLELHVVGDFVAAFGFGALLSSMVLAGDGAARAWTRTALFGVIAGIVLGSIAELRHGPPVDAVDIFGYALTVGVICPLLRWLAVKGAADQRPSNP